MSVYQTSVSQMSVFLNSIRPKDVTLPQNMLGLTLRRNELGIRSDIITQLVFSNQVLPPDVFSRVTIGEYAAGQGILNEEVSLYH
jgi:hypothetical protein